MNKKHIYILMGLTLIVMLSLYIGRSIGQKDEKDARIVERVKVIQVENGKSNQKIDSLNSVIKNLSHKTSNVVEKQIIVREKTKNIVLEKPVNTTDCDELYDESVRKISLLEESLLLGDTIQRNLKFIIADQNDVIINKDKIIANKDHEMQLIKEIQKPRVKKYSVGIQVGYGATVTTQNNTVTFKTAPYIGVGITRAIFSF